jgi:hypothetical protein
VVLSRWKVDDTATVLLMVRFYENLLGSRGKKLGHARGVRHGRARLTDEDVLAIRRRCGGTSPERVDSVGRWGRWGGHGRAEVVR